jgi:hypothetical protein
MAKEPKSAVQFEHPAQGPNHCGMCRHFSSPHACELVAGTIARRDWCKLFKAYRKKRSR